MRSKRIGVTLPAAAAVLAGRGSVQEALGFTVEERMFYGGKHSNGDFDSLSATWRN